MALSSAQKDQINGWADQLETTASWYTGARALTVQNIINEMREAAGGEKASTRKQPSTEGADE